MLSPWSRGQGLCAAADIMHLGKIASRAEDRGFKSRAENAQKATQSRVAGLPKIRCNISEIQRVVEDCEDLQRAPESPSDECARSLQAHRIFPQGVRALLRELA